MKVEIWSDVICPWCGIGQHRLDQAIAKAGRAVDVVHRSFQLDPRHRDGTRPVRDMLAQKHRLDAAQVAAATARVEGIAKADGIVPYHTGDNIVGNTGLAHEWLAFASERGHEDAAWKRIYKAYFGEMRSIFDIESLVVLGEELGLDAAEQRAALRERRYRARVEDDQREAASLGATGVPFIVIDRRIGIAGAQPVDTIAKALAS